MLIGLAGKKRSGKDTVARMLQEDHQFVASSFAAPIRLFVAHLLGSTLGELEVEKELPVAALDGVTPRHMMQTVGTEWGRQMIHPELWTRSWWLRHRAEIEAGVNVVVSDVRFPNESAIIRAHGGCIVEIERPGLLHDDSHISEERLPRDLIDFVIYNDSDLDALRQQVASLVSTVQQREVLRNV